jgi:hypothetical protein
VRIAATALDEAALNLEVCHQPSWGGPLLLGSCRLPLASLPQGVEKELEVHLGGMAQLDDASIVRARGALRLSLRLLADPGPSHVSFLSTATALGGPLAPPPPPPSASAPAVLEDPAAGATGSPEAEERAARARRDLLLRTASRRRHEVMEQARRGLGGAEVGHQGYLLLKLKVRSSAGNGR